MKNKTSATLMIFFGAIAVMGALGILNRGQDEKPGQVDVPSVYDEIMAIDLDNGYPMDPALVLDINNKITAYLYGGSITDDEIGPVVRKQRRLYAKILASINDEDEQIENAKAHLDLLRKNNQRLLDIKAQPPVFDTENSDICSALVVQYTNTKVNNELLYYLQKEDGLWKIASFRFAEEDEGDAAEGTESVDESDI